MSTRRERLAPARTAIYEDWTDEHGTTHTGFDGNFLGHHSRECGEHRTLGPHRAWCFDCGEYCYPSDDGACLGCQRAREKAERHGDAKTALEWCLAGWMTLGVGVGYRDLTNVYEALTGEEAPRWSAPDRHTTGTDEQSHDDQDETPENVALDESDDPEDDQDHSEDNQQSSH